jgi:DUF4097 and DUF4098 domain-containing protein YvlB
MRRTIIALLLTAALPLSAGAECRYSEPRNADMDAAGLNALSFTLGSTDMEIHAVQGLTKVEVRGMACASDASWLKDLQIGSNRHGNAAAVVAKNNHRDTGSGFSGARYAYLKLQVRMPASLAVDVDSGSGDVKADGLASLDFGSGSGDLDARNIGGTLKLALGSADVEARQVGGVELDQTGSGDVHVDGVRGDVRAGRSGSGDLTFDNVTGHVNIGDVGSGDITLNHVGREVKIDSIGSGDVDADGIGGDFTVSASGSGSGDIRHENVKGKVSVPTRRRD